MKRQNIRTISLVVITLTYLIIGAAVFDHFESSNERKQNTRLNHYITQFKMRHKMNDSEFNKLWFKMLDKKPYYAGNQWKFVGSLYFCTVVVTLIGYGHSTPRTLPGKFFCIFYTVFGIPIFLIMFQSVGERLNSFIIFILTRIKKKFKLKNQEVGLFELITVEGFFTMTIILVASYIFMRNEDWTYFDAIYYCFITLTTIGFGDYVPLQKNNFLTNNLTYASFTILFILIGLTTLASSMNLLVLRLATINAEEQVQERLEAAEARRQAVHLEGDVISPNSRLFAVQPEKPEQLDTISVCSCACLDYKIFHNKRSKRKAFLKNELEAFNLTNSSVCTQNNINTSNNNTISDNREKRYFSMSSIFNKTVPVKRLIVGNKVKRNNVLAISSEIEMKARGVDSTNLASSVSKNNNDNSSITFSKAHTVSGHSNNQNSLNVNFKRNSI